MVGVPDTVASQKTIESLAVARGIPHTLVTVSGCDPTDLAKGERYEALRGQSVL